MHLDNQSGLGKWVRQLGPLDNLLKGETRIQHSTRAQAPSIRATVKGLGLALSPVRAKVPAVKPMVGS